MLLFFPAISGLAPTTHRNAAGHVERILGVSRHFELKNSCLNIANSAASTAIPPRSKFAMAALTSDTRRLGSDQGKRMIYKRKSTEISLIFALEGQF